MKNTTQTPKHGQRDAATCNTQPLLDQASRREFFQVAAGAVGASLVASCASEDFIESSTLAVDEEFALDAIKAIVLKCARYRLSRGVTDLSDFYRGSAGSWRNYIWDVGAYMSGVAAGYRLTRDPSLLTSLMQYGNNANWRLVGGAGDSNAWCPLQVFIDVYMFDKNPANLDRMCKGTFDAARGLLGTRATSWGLNDWLFMSPTCVPRVCEAYKSTQESVVTTLLTNLGTSWKNTARNLYSTEYKLWWRDSSYKTARTPNGSPVFWCGGVAWAIGALARIIEYMPGDHPDMPYYIQQFKDVCGALRQAPALGADGMWRTSLLDYNQFPQMESICSAFFGYCFAFGVNRGYLDRATYEPHIRKTWSQLVKNIAADGRLQWCQEVTERPTAVRQSNSAPEGEGAFMLMAEELAKMLSGGVDGGTRGSGGTTGQDGSAGGSDGASGIDGGGATSRGGAGGGTSSSGGPRGGNTSAGTGGGAGGPGTAGATSPAGGGGAGGATTPTGQGGSGAGGATNSATPTQASGTSGCDCEVGGRRHGGAKWGAMLAVGAVLADQFRRLSLRRQLLSGSSVPTGEADAVRPETTASSPTDAHEKDERS